MAPTPHVGRPADTRTPNQLLAEELYLTLAETARVLRVSRDTVRRLAVEGRLTPLPGMGRRVVYASADVLTVGALDGEGPAVPSPAEAAARIAELLDELDYTDPAVRAHPSSQAKRPRLAIAPAAEEATP